MSKARQPKSAQARKELPAQPPPSPPVAIAIGAHPDDIEFYMAGTLLLLARRGWEIHYLTIANGSCGSSIYNARTTVFIRRREARDAAKRLGAKFHVSLVNDLTIVYRLTLLQRIAAIIRAVQPQVLLTHSPDDYMEDHTNTCRLAVSAAFAHGMRNFHTLPPREPFDGDITVYHAMPHGLRDPLRRPVIPGAFVNTTTVVALKRDALAAHQSQKAWLDVSQGMDSYLQTMDQMSLALGKMSKAFTHAEGWRRHLHLGFSRTELDPLGEALGADYQLNPASELTSQTD